jgi:gamma-glutamyltranspeptidase / glutathione hydrolase
MAYPLTTLPRFGASLATATATATLLTLALAAAAAGPAMGQATGQATVPASPATTAIPAAPAIPAIPAAPEIATGFAARPLAVADRFMAVTAHPLATATARDVLARGGSALDAAIAAQMVLNLVEPQSSGIGGGGFLMHFDAGTREVLAYDGRETAPRGAGPNYLRHADESGAGEPVVPDARSSGRSIGTPGLVRMLALAHARHGRLPWHELLQPAIALSREGFEISPRMAESIAASRGQLARDPQAATYFLLADGSPKPAGSRLTNPALAETLAALAAHGPDALHRGERAQAIVAAIRADTVGTTRVTPGATTLDDLAQYRALVRAPVCAPYGGHEVCGMPPPSSGGIAVAQALGILSHLDVSRHGPALSGERGAPAWTVDGAHRLAEAHRLAFADRNRYVADTDFVPLPGGSWQALLEPAYLRERAALVSPQRSLGTAAPGTPVAPGGTGQGGTDATSRTSGTTHLSVVDADGNAVSMTTSIEGAFGAYRMVHGFLLNNQLTDFSTAPADANGPVANRVEPLKRPRSSMAPTLVFRRNADGSRGDFVMATGSPGGAAIIHHVTKALVATLDWGLDPQQAAALPNLGSFNGPNTVIEPDGAGQPGSLDGLAAALGDRGHRIARMPLTSGIGTILRTRVDGRPVLLGGADPRRETLALGDRDRPPRNPAAAVPGAPR